MRVVQPALEEKRGRGGEAVVALALPVGKGGLLVALPLLEPGIVCPVASEFEKLLYLMNWTVWPIVKLPIFSFSFFQAGCSV